LNNKPTISERMPKPHWSALRILIRLPVCSGFARPFLHLTAGRVGLLPT